jgi:hypothetical protein
MERILEKNYDCLYDLGYSHEDISAMLLQELNGYEYISDLEEFQEGSHLRWIALEKEPRKITRGAIFCLKKTTKENDSVLLCKNYGTKSMFQLDPVKNVIFQKMSVEERILARAIDFSLNNEKKNNIQDKKKGQKITKINKQTTFFF